MEQAVAARLQTSIRGLSPQAGGFRRRPNRPSSVGRGSRRSLTHCPQGRLPCVTASVYQAPAVPYHTPIRGSLSTPNIAALSSGEQYNTKQTPQNGCFSGKMKPPSGEDGLFCLGCVACLRALAAKSETVPAACRWFAQCANTPEAQARASHAEEEQKTARRLRNGGEGDGATAARRAQLLLWVAH